MKKVERLVVVPSTGRVSLEATVLSALTLISERDALLIFLNVDHVDLGSFNFLVSDSRVNLRIATKGPLSMHDSIHAALDFALQDFSAEWIIILGDDDRLISLGDFPIVGQASALGLFDVYDARLGKLRARSPLGDKAYSTADQALRDLFTNPSLLDFGTFALSGSLLRRTVQNKISEDGTFHEMYTELILAIDDSIANEPKHGFRLYVMEGTKVSLGVPGPKTWSKHHAQALFGEVAFLEALPTAHFPSARELSRARMKRITRLSSLLHMTFVQVGPVMYWKFPFLMDLTFAEKAKFGLANLFGTWFRRLIRFG